MIIPLQSSSWVAKLTAKHAISPSPATLYTVLGQYDFANLGAGIHGNDSPWDWGKRRNERAAYLEHSPKASGNTFQNPLLMILVVSAM